MRHRGKAGEGLGSRVPVCWLFSSPMPGDKDLGDSNRTKGSRIQQTCLEKRATPHMQDGHTGSPSTGALSADTSTCPGHTQTWQVACKSYAITHMLRRPETYRAGHTDPCSLTQVLMETPHLYSCTLVHREPWTSRPKDTHSHTFSQVLSQPTKTISTHAQAQKYTRHAYI